MICPLCNKCGKELTDFGAILLSPPEGLKVDKYHLCVECYRKIAEQEKAIAELVEGIKTIKKGAEYYLRDGFECDKDAHNYPHTIQWACDRLLAKHKTHTKEEG